MWCAQVGAMRLSPYCALRLLRLTADLRKRAEAALIPALSAPCDDARVACLRRDVHASVFTWQETGAWKVEPNGGLEIQEARKAR